MDIKVDIKQAKREFFKLRGRFVKLQKTIIVGALLDASEPLVTTAQSLAPVRSGRLRGRIGPTLDKSKGQLRVDVGPIRLRKNDKQFPFYGRFQELGWRHTGTAPRKSAKRFKQIEGKHFLRDAGTQNFSRMEQIFAARVFKDFAEVQSAGEAAGLV